jgi:DNA polymerase-1
MTRIEELFSGDAPKKSLNDMPMDQAAIEKVSPYACADADCALQLLEKLDPILKEKKCESLFYNLEMPLVEILAEMEMTGIKVDTEYLKNLDRRFTKDIGELEKRAHSLAGQEFNLNSSKQLSFILFEKLGLPTAKKTKTGFSTDEEVLNALSSSHELPHVLIQHRELSKLKSTYIDGLCAQANPSSSRVHSSFNQTGTSTGRLSSSDPNLQNIPIRTEQGRMIRRAFVPEKGNVFLSADYSQIDLRVLAHLSRDPVLSKAFHDGADIHRVLHMVVKKAAAPRLSAYPRQMCPKSREKEPRRSISELFTVSNPSGFHRALASP